MKDHYGYLHGYNKEEQDRLERQARFFERHIYADVSWPEGSTEILELGCGVGAQTEILLRRFSAISVTGVDRSPEQLERAKKNLTKQIKAGRARMVKAPGDKLPFEENQFHGAFMTWLLEHVAKPVDLLKEAHRVLQPGAVLYATEILNSSNFLSPYSPATLQYWFAFNERQWNMGGDPFAGAKLGNNLLDAGFQEVRTKVISIHLDKRSPKTRIEAMKDSLDLLMSAAPSLLEAKLVSKELVNDLKKEWEVALKDPEAILFYSVVQGRGTAL
jgi:SAM-dependent methyltransferase